MTLNEALLELEVLTLRAIVARYEKEAMVRAVAHLPVQGPCRRGEWRDPHTWEHVPFSDGTSKCIKCGDYSGK